MTQQYARELREFKGLKNDDTDKNVPFEYFYKIKNFNFPKTGLKGMEQILMPERKKQIGSGEWDGMFEYRFLDENNILRVQNIGVKEGNIYKTILGTEVLLKSGLTAGYVDFKVYQDKLFIFNGKNCPQVYWGSKGAVAEMGAPLAEDSGVAGSLTGTYYWAMTYVTAGGEEVLGSVSNTLTLSLKRAKLNLPLGYTGVTSRKIYRTVNGGTQLKFVGTVSDNTTSTYTDTISDSALGANIPAINNELPKPYFGETSLNQLFGAKVDKYPTQVFITEEGIEVFDLAQGFTDVANYGNDNTAVEGIGLDFGKIIVGTGKNIAFINSDNTVSFTRANIGIKNGYTVVNVPAFEGFAGGAMFVSTEDDVRVMSGQQAITVATTFDNIQTENWAQNIRGSLTSNLKSNPNLYAEFYDYKYHLLVDYTKYCFDIRKQEWTYHHILTDNYESQPRILATLGSKLYNGQIDGWIEEEYSTIAYRGENVECYLESPSIDVSTMWKMLEYMIFWFKMSKNTELRIDITTDNNDKFIISNTFKLNGGAFNPEIYNPNYYLTDNIGMDYRVINIYRNARWFKYKLTVTAGNVNYQGWAFIAQALKNKEK